MIVIGKTVFDFEMEDEKFALHLYEQWDRFCLSEFNPVVDRILSSKDRESAVIHIDTLSMDLGTFTEEEFYKKFAGRLAEKLKASVHDLLQHPTRHDVKFYPVSQAHHDALIHYLMYGYLKWDTDFDTFHVERYTRQSIEEHPREFRRFLQTEGHRESLRKRLIYRLEDPILESLVVLTEPGESTFINTYTGFLIRNHTNLPHLDIPKRDYRNAVWLLVLTYIWSKSRGYFSRKEIVRHTLTGLSAHFGISKSEWIDLITNGVKGLLAGEVIQHELLEILEEIGYEEALHRIVSSPDTINECSTRIFPERFLEKLSQHGGFQKKIEENRNKQDFAQEVREQLAERRTRRKILSGLKEEEIHLLLKIIEPTESLFIVAYATMLEHEKDKGAFEGKAGSDFRFVKWEFIFAVLLNRPSGNLNRKQFVSDVLRQLAKHYGIDYSSLVDYFKKEENDFPVWLTNILFELEHETSVNETVKLAKGNAKEILPVERKKLLELLVHPLSCRQLLSRLHEKEIRSLVQWVVPKEKEFILSYAEKIEHEKDRGMFEAHVGQEFSKLKWEFIFQLALHDTFNRKRFALEVLQELGAHYFLDVKNLLDYLYHTLEYDQSGTTSGLSQIIKELWLDVQGNHAETETVLRVCNTEERELGILKDYWMTGCVPEEIQNIYSLFLKFKSRSPVKLMHLIRSLGPVSLSCSITQTPETVQLNAALLSWLMEEDHSYFSENVALNHLLYSARTGNIKIEVRKLRHLICCYIADKKNEFLGILDHQELPKIPFSEKDIPALLTLFIEYRQPAVAALIRREKEKIYKWLISTTGIEATRNLCIQMQLNPGLLLFVKEVFGTDRFIGITGKEEIERLSPEMVNSDLLRQVLTKRTLPEEGRMWQKKLWEKEATRTRVVAVLNENPILQRLWIEQAGNTFLRRISSEIILLERKIPFTLPQKQIWEQLVKFTLPEYSNCSERELYTRILKKLLAQLTEKQKEEVFNVLDRKPSEFARWRESSHLLKYKTTTMKKESTHEKVSPIHNEGSTGEQQPHPLMTEIHNAGLALLSPWFPQLFSKLGLLSESKREFINTDAKIRACFLLEALIHDDVVKYEESDLVFNRLLTGLSMEEALPDRIELTPEEKETLHSLLTSVSQNWPKMKNTSIKGLQHSFLQREGMLEDKQDYYSLTVAPQAYDILLDSLPWSFSLIKQTWMEKRFIVTWR